MNTVIKKINTEILTEKDFLEAKEILKKGGLVAFPTETVYGLGADALNENAAAKIYEAKGRPSDNPLIVHISDIKDLTRIAKNIPSKAKILMETFWPGPLTLIFEKKEEVPKGTTGGLDTVAVRMPNHPVALALIESSEVLIAAPSANTSGKPSPTMAEHVILDMQGKIDMILDGGKVGIGIESTIVDVTTEPPMILRPGYITKEMLEEKIGAVQIDKVVEAKTIQEIKQENYQPKAPGMKYRHYAPKADLTMFEGSNEQMIQMIKEKQKEAIKAGKKVGILCCDESKENYQGEYIFSVGSRKNIETIAANLYQVLRAFDETNVDVILGETFYGNELGAAVMNRLIKAAGYKVICCEE